MVVFVYVLICGFMIEKNGEALVEGGAALLLVIVSLFWFWFWFLVFGYVL
jgi:hypothetical protein